MAYLRQQQVKVQSDVKLGIQALRSELGLTIQDTPTRLSLYSLHRVQEMLLQYLMINSLYNAPITQEYQLPVGPPTNAGLQAELGATDSIT